MTQQKMSLHVWINEMADEQKSGDEIALYIPSHMYRRHAFVYTHMFWWTTLLYTLPIQEKDLMERCEIVLIFLKPGVFGELHKIHTPTASVTSGSTMVPTTLPPVIPQNTEQQSHDVMTTLTTPLVTTGGATETKPVPPRSMDSQIVTCRNEDSNINTQSGQPIVSTRLNEQETTDTPASALPKIDIFMTQHYSIPLIRCDYESALKAADTHRKKSAIANNTGNSPQPNTSLDKTNHPDVSKPEVCTSGRTHTVIDYKKFLEDYADEPPSPSSKKHDVDLKHQPSKQRNAAEKYKSIFVTKPTHVYHKITKKQSTFTTNPPAPTSKPIEMDSSVGTVLTPATSREAIEALLMLGELPVTDKPQVPDDDNALLVPITGAPITPPTKPPAPLIEQQEDIATEHHDKSTVAKNKPPTDPINENAANTEAPLSGAVLGVALKTDMGKGGLSDNKPKPIQARKELSFKQYCIKWKYKSTHKFKCNLCSTELPSVQEYNKHNIDNHPPRPCPDCNRLLTSPRTLAKHHYTHAEFMFECQDCGHGFIFMYEGPTTKSRTP